MELNNIEQKKLLKPVIDENWRVIAPKPDLTSFSLQPPADSERINECNDHGFIQGLDGIWHLWSCVRCTGIGRILCHWETDNIFNSPWKFTEDIIRADKSVGESLVEWMGQEFIQSPFLVKENDTYYLFYGGYATGCDSDGNPTEDYNLMENQISLMTSKDCRNWTRYRNEQGLSRLFVGPGAARDEYVVRFGDTWYIYYAGHHDRNSKLAAIYVRTSSDLIHWSDWSIAQYEYGDDITPYIAESPVVVFRNGYYYLFRSNGAFGGGTYVYRSENPLDFGQGDISDKFVCKLPLIAPEIITYDNSEYISNIIDNDKFNHIRLCRLTWAEI